MKRLGPRALHLIATVSLIAALVLIALWVSSHYYGFQVGYVRQDSGQPDISYQTSVSNSWGNIRIDTSQWQAVQIESRRRSGWYGGYWPPNRMEPIFYSGQAFIPTASSRINHWAISGFRSDELSCLPMGPSEVPPPRVAWPVVITQWFIPHWALTIFSGLLPLICFCARIRQRSVALYRKRCGWCVACGYDLRATPDRCPECGAVPEAARGVAK